MLTHYPADLNLIKLKSSAIGHPLTDGPLDGLQLISHYGQGVGSHWFRHQRQGAQAESHTPSITFCTRFSYATEGALFISALLSTDAVSALPKVPVLIYLLKQPSAKACT